MKTVCAFAILAITIGCARSSTEPSGPSDPPGGVELGVSPSSVAFEPPLAPPQGPGHPACTQTPRLSAWGPFVWTVRETGGGTVTLTSFSYVTTTQGRGLGSGQIAPGILGGTATPTLTIGPNQSLSSTQKYSCETTVSNGLPRDLNAGGQTVFTVSGTDSNGAAVTATATLTLEPSPFQ